MDSFELEPSPGFQPQQDRRRRIDEPPPVRLVAVEDTSILSSPGLEKELDDFFVTMLKFEKESASETQIVYRAENFRLRVQIQTEAIVRTDMRALGIEVPVLADIRGELIEREIEYTHQRGLVPGQESLLLLDPAGNWIELTEAIRIV